MDINTDEFNRVNYAHIRDANNLIDRIIDESGEKWDFEYDFHLTFTNLSLTLTNFINFDYTLTKAVLEMNL